MEICGLEDAKKHLEQFIEQSKKYLLTIEDDHTQYTRNKYVEMCEDVKAIDTVLKALEEQQKEIEELKQKLLQSKEEYDALEDVVNTIY